MTGAEFYAYVLNKFKRTDKETEFYQACTDVIADMRSQFYSEDYKEEAYITGITTIGDYRLALPSDFGHLLGDISVVDSDNSLVGKLSKISKDTYDSLYLDRMFDDADDMYTSEPEHYCIYAGQIYIGPVPDKTTYKYQMNYTTEAFTEVTSATDPVPFTDENRNTLRSGVLAELYGGVEEFEEASYYEQKYIRGLELLANKDNLNISDNEPASYSGF